jgi:lysophospholipase L1-like esterase
MIMKMKLTISVLLLTCVLGFKTEDKIIVYLIGDSTVAAKQVETYPETGWGMPFAWFFNQSVKVDNRAMNGRSTRSFIEENRWAPVVKALHPGDYVFIQFGHNDEVPTKKTYTTEIEFVKYLTQYVNETKAKGASPILITPVTRRSFNKDGQLEDTHKVYAQLVRNLASELNVPLIDLCQSSMDLIQILGFDKSKMLYNHLTPGENPNYPNGKVDDTHFNELGARKMAQLILASIKTLNLPLSKHIVTSTK